MVIESINIGPSSIEVSFANVVKKIKFSQTSLANKLVTQLKIYFVTISNLQSVDLAIKQIIFICWIIFLKAYSKVSLTNSSYSFPLVSPNPWLSIIISGLLL